MPFSVSNILILISVVFTIIASFFPNIYILWMSSFFLDKQQYITVFMQFFSYSFIHGGFLHLFFNGIFLYYFWNIVEQIMGIKKYLLFFIGNTFFVGLILLLFSSGNTVGISGFCMALLTYYTLHLKRKNNPEYKWWITAIIVNIAITVNPEISLLGHLFWAIFWGFFRWIERKLSYKNHLHK